MRSKNKKGRQRSVKEMSTNLTMVDEVKMEI